MTRTAPRTGTAAPHRLVLPIVLIATFMQLLDVTIVQVALPAIQRDLHAGPGALRLVLAGYTLAYACTLITAARLGDRHGYRRLFTIGLVVFAFASGACTFAPDAAILVTARLVQGVGSGLMAPQVLSIIRTAVPEARRPRALGLFGATIGIASLAGPLLGGVLLTADAFGLGWRLIFLVNIPISLLALAGTRLLPPGGARGTSTVDGVGAVLAATGLGMVILPLSLSRDLGWPWWWTCACLAAAAVVLALFVRGQRTRAEPLLHPSVPGDATTRAGLLLVLAFNAGVPSFTYLLLLHLQAEAGYSALQAGLISAPYPVGAVLGSRVAPRLAARFGPRLLTAAALVLAVSMLGFGYAITSLWAVLPLLALSGTAFGMFTSSVFAVVLARAEPAAVGSVAGLLPTAQQLGGSLGVTLAGSAYVAAGESFGPAMLYEAAAFGLAAAISLRLRRP